MRVQGAVTTFAGSGIFAAAGSVAWCEGKIGSIDQIYADGHVLPAPFYYTGGIGPAWPPSPIFDNFGYTHHLGVEAEYWYASTTFDIWATLYWMTHAWWSILGVAQDSPIEWAADVHGLCLYDPRADSTNGGSGTQRYTDPTTWVYSANPALIVRDLLTRYGGVPAALLNDTSFAVAANACDSIGFTCNVCFATQTSLATALALVLQTCNGVLIDVGGRKGIFLDSPNADPPVLTLLEEDGDVWDLTYEWLSARDRYTRVAVSFTNAAANYAPDQTPDFDDPGVASSEPTLAILSATESTNVIVLASSPGWIINDTVLYEQVGGTPIAGLVSGTTYFVKTIAGASLTLSETSGGSIVDITADGVGALQYLQRVGNAYPPTIPIKAEVVNAPGITTLAAAIILRDYLYNVQAITFRISGTMSAKGILLQQGQKVRITTLKGVDMDCLITQITTDQKGFFPFVLRPYDVDVFGTTPVSQPPPVGPPVPPNPATNPGLDIIVTDTAGERRVVFSSTPSQTVYHLFQLIQYQLPTTGAALASLSARGFQGTGAGTKTWDDMIASDLSIPLQGNEPRPDASHDMLSHPGVIKTVETLTFDVSGQLIQTVSVVGPTRIIIKTATAANALSPGVTIDVAASTTTVSNPRTDVARFSWIKFTQDADGSRTVFAIPTTWVAGTLMVVRDGQVCADASFNPVQGADYSVSGLNVTFAIPPLSWAGCLYQPSVNP